MKSKITKLSITVVVGSLLLAACGGLSLLQGQGQVQTQPQAPVVTIPQQAPAQPQTTTSTNNNNGVTISLSGYETTLRWKIFMPRSTRR